MSLISAATRTAAPCAKRDRSGLPIGACTIGAGSANAPVDWLACPARVLDTDFTLLDLAVRRLFGVPAGERLVLRPVSALAVETVHDEVTAALADGGARVFVFSQRFLGGEVSIPGTAGSPAASIDSSVVELVSDGTGGFHLGQYVLFEIQTMDFHGSPLHARARLTAARDADPISYHQDIAEHPEWTGERVEGPNIANVFKRTIYQTILEIQMARDPECAGFAIVLPLPVWESWYAHLGLPQLEEDGGVWWLRAPVSRESGLVEPARAWIFVFDIDRDSAESPQPLAVRRPISTTSADLLHYAFERAPQYAIENGALTRYKRSLEVRVRRYWPR